jgi:hypothetical protein
MKYLDQHATRAKGDEPHQNPIVGPMECLPEEVGAVQRIDQCQNELGHPHTMLRGAIYQLQSAK